MPSDHHDSWCKWPAGPPCHSFSTDGTRLGAEIAHTMGTTDEEAIKQDGQVPFLSDVADEQADWDAEEHDYVPVYEHTACNGKGCEGCGWVGTAPLDEPKRPQTTEERERLEAEEQEGIRNGTVVETHRYGRGVQPCGLVHPPTEHCGHGGGQ